MSTYYDDYRNSYYNPDDVEEQPGDNQNWKMIQKGFDAVENDVRDTAFYNIFSTGETTFRANTVTDFKVSLPSATKAKLGTSGNYRMEYQLVVGGGTGNLVLIPVTDPFIKIGSGANIKITYNIAGPAYYTADDANVGIMIQNFSDTDITPARYDILLVVHFIPVK